jgi:hypothetical protein
VRRVTKTLEHSACETSHKNLPRIALFLLKAVDCMSLSEELPLNRVEWCRWWTSRMRRLDEVGEKEVLGEGSESPMSGRGPGAGSGKLTSRGKSGGGSTKPPDKEPIYGSSEYSDGPVPQ